MPECQLSKEYVLDIGQIDYRGIARPSAIVDFMQDLATRHAEVMGISGESLREKNAFWVLSRLKYYLNRPLTSYETVRLTTWPREIKGAAWYRDFQFEVEGETVGHAVTAWAIVDLTEHRLVRPKSIGLGFEPQLRGERELLKSISMEASEPCFDRVVRYSDIDVNRHLNNVKAVDILSDAFDMENREELWMPQMQVNYLSESACGTTLAVSRSTAEDSMCVSAASGDTVKVQAEVKFAPMPLA